jgi:hypothetical protein
VAATNTLDTLFKQVYGDGAIQAVPEFAKLMKRVSFSQREKLGEDYVVPVVLQHEHGFTYGASGDGDFTLNASVAGKVLKAKIHGSMIVLRSRLSYEDVFKASEAGAAAFESATSLVVDNMQRSFAKRQELAFIYGQMGIGQVSGAPVVSTNATVTLTDASWAPGIWSGMKDCPLDCFSAQTDTATKRNANANLVVVSVTFSSKAVVLSGNNTDLNAIADADHLYFLSARTATGFKECAGIDKILSVSATIFNIDASLYELWKGSEHSVGGPISMLGALNGISKAVNMGLLEDSVIYLAATRWNSLNADQAALRRYGAEIAAKAKSGSRAITYCSTNGDNEIEAHPFYKEGFAHLLPNPSKRLLRVGATDITFRRPGMDETIFRELTDNAGLELRAFADQAIMLQIPAHGVRYSGITD